MDCDRDGGLGTETVNVMKANVNVADSEIILKTAYLDSNKSQTTLIENKKCAYENFNNENGDKDPPISESEESTVKESSVDQNTVPDDLVEFSNIEVRDENVQFVKSVEASDCQNNISCNDQADTEKYLNQQTDAVEPALTTLGSSTSIAEDFNKDFNGKCGNLNSEIIEEDIANILIEQDKQISENVPFLENEISEKRQIESNDATISNEVEQIIENACNESVETISFHKTNIDFTDLDISKVKSVNNPLDHSKTIENPCLNEINSDSSNLLKSKEDTYPYEISMDSPDLVKSDVSVMNSICKVNCEKDLTKEENEVEKIIKLNDLEKCDKEVTEEFSPSNECDYQETDKESKVFVDCGDKNITESIDSENECDYQKIYKKSKLFLDCGDKKIIESVDSENECDYKKTDKESKVFVDCGDKKIIESTDLGKYDEKVIEEMNDSNICDDKKIEKESNEFGSCEGKIITEESDGADKVDDDKSLDDEFLILSDDDGDSISAHCIDMNISDDEYCEIKETGKESSIEMEVSETEVSPSKINVVANNSEMKAEILDDSDDEIDSLLPEFVDSEFANKEKIDEKCGSVILSDSEGEMDSAIEAFKAIESDDDCLIIEDDADEIVLSDDKSVKTIKLDDSSKELRTPADDCDVSVFSSTPEAMMKIPQDNEKSSYNDIKHQDTSVIKLERDDAFSNNDNQDKAVCTINDSSKNDHAEMEINSSLSNMNCNAKSEQSNDSDDSGVLDLINQNLDSIVSLISVPKEENPETIKVDVKTVVSPDDVNNVNNCCAIKLFESCMGDIKLSVKDLLIHLINTVEGQDLKPTLIDEHMASENSNDNSMDIEIDELMSKEMLLMSSGEDDSIDSPLSIPVLCPEKNAIEVHSTELKSVVDSVESIVRENISTQLNSTESQSQVASELTNGDNSSDTNAIEESTITNPSKVSDSISSEPTCIPPVIQGLFLTCNNIDTNNHVEKTEVTKVTSPNEITDKAEKNEITKSNYKSIMKEESASDSSEVLVKNKIEKENIDDSVKEKLEDTPGAVEAVTNFQTRESWLNKIARDLCVKIVTGMHSKEIKELEEKVQDMEENIKISNNDLELFRKQASEFYSAQEKTFKGNNYDPKVPTRTVGVNVKIFRECDLQSLQPPKRVSSSPSTSSSSVSLSPSYQSSLNPSTTTATVIPSEKAKYLLSSLPKTPTTPSIPNIPSSSFKPATPHPPQPATSLVPPGFNTMTSNSRPRQIIPPSVTRYPPPNATVTRSGLPPTLNTRNVANTNILTTSQKRKSDVMETNDMAAATSNKRFGTAVMNAVPANTTVAKVNLPPGMQGSNVLLPLSNLVQILPQSQNATSSTVTNTSQIPRHLIPPMPSSLLGQRTVGYIVTPPGVTNSIGGRGISVPNIISNPNQRLQTFLVRVTNPTTMTPRSSVLNSSPRLNSVPHTSNTTTTNSAPGLVLFSRTAKHPAPFPQMPAYPMNTKMKALPPKPSLKGSKAANGIVLSWNMPLNTNTYAEIAAYQLFAYQETSNVPITASLWKPVGKVKALPLPMACTLTQFVEGHRYFFTIRAIDCHSRHGPFSLPITVMYSKH